MHDGKANSGPLDFFYLIKRRKGTLEGFCTQNGIKTFQQFQDWATSLEAQKEFYVTAASFDAAKALLQASESPPEAQSTEATVEYLADPVEPPEPQEKAYGKKKEKKTVQ
jgi:hypothetical protein